MGARPPPRKGLLFGRRRLRGPGSGPPPNGSVGDGEAEARFQCVRRSDDYSRLPQAFGGTVEEEGQERRWSTLADTFGASWIAVGQIRRCGHEGEF